MASLGRTLISLGFSDLEGSSRFLAAPELTGVDQQVLFDGLPLAADPDLALRSLVRMLATGGQLEQQLRMLLSVEQQIVPASVSGAEASAAGGSSGMTAAGPLFRLLGASEALADFLIRAPEESELLAAAPAAEFLRTDPEELRRSLLEAVGADPDAAVPVAAQPEPDAPAALSFALRRRYRRHLTSLAIRDLCTVSPVDAMPLVAAELADLAAAAIEAALAVSRAELAGSEPAEDIAAVRFAVIGMGKCGARELNYISDVDVIYVVEADAQTAPTEQPGAHRGAALEAEAVHRLGTRLATGIAKVISAPGAEPGLWEIDPNLRPEGKDGPLVRSLESHLEYYRRWAASWEFQALLKARCIAGDRELGERYAQAIAPLVWASSEREGFVDSVRAMRRRVSDHIPAEERDWQLKLGEGGLRDVEFTVQLLQLVHGKTDVQLRHQDTLGALEALAAGSYIGAADAAALDAAYRYLRVLEHRIQLVRLRRSHVMPSGEPELRALARSSRGVPQASARPRAETFLADWRAVKRRVRSLHEQIFYQPLLATAAHLSAEETSLTPEAARARLAALGYLDGAGAMRHIEALTVGLSRCAALQRHLLPVLLGWLAEGVDPDAGLLAFRRLSESLGQSPWYLSMLRDSPAGAERLCHVLSSSRLIADLLEVSPEQTAWLGSDRELRPQSFGMLWQEVRSKMSRHPGAAAAMRLIRLIRRREMLRVALADSAGLVDTQSMGQALADIDRVTILGALRAAEKQLAASGEPEKTKVLVVAMGRQGGREIGYGSDADVIFVHRALPGFTADEAQEQAGRLVATLTNLLTQPLTPAILAERPLVLDAGLRPEGKNGPMVRSLDSYRQYYERWSLIWEAQALLRARPIAGDDALAEDFLALIDPIRYPETISEDELREIRRIKARVEAERLPRGADPNRQLKLGRGGLSDIEWLIQMLQLQYAHQYPGLRTTSTLPALEAAAEAGLMAQEDAQVLRRAWLLASQIRSGTVLWRGKANDQLPSARRDLEAVARWCGYPPDHGGQLEEDYLRATRQARSVVERVFYGYH
ncbi:bifunctional [glutamine synthetase] adenylyltransferase/[glutamine synthetase]-adenylyl-L-tyrosine phosphorylase [Acaricomes phytoseiuli]|uniref:bifunctional [glutamine synthetase] adenylyltransferase/[glutamine synthetase]-adenylyl-L-tyrosine phosphorylase n=1 Tax=Acaricomes phytoseiuli TaxID=291968 RepID=UPI00036EE35D|nr:bifunctional [glutamine synthetase] adenylyltransferase/[glutamine synthetase]-adenylyl-L-tyrosine phosphorylase [Acaricomes phytoseiuli]